MSYKGRYSPTYPRKYKGNHTNIVYRSLWERKFMVYCDLNENILREETTFNDSQLSDQMKRSNIDGKNDDKLQSKQNKVGEKDALVSYVETQEEKPLISPI